MNPRLEGLGVRQVMDMVPWGLGDWPTRAEVEFDYPEDAIKRLTTGTIFVCRVRQLDCDFYGIVGPYAHFLAIERGARFIYFLDGEPRDYLDLPLNSDDLLLPPWRIQYRAKTFSPSGFPFQRIEGKADPEAFFTSHPTIQADSAEPGPYDRPPGGRPAPMSPNMSSDFSVAWHLVAAHWLRTEGPAA